MSTFLAEWGLAILISLAVLGVLILAEWRDHRDGLYDEDDDEPSPKAYDPDQHNHVPTGRTYASTIDAPAANAVNTDWRTAGPYRLDRD